jgi:hypothetical protein
MDLMETNPSATAEECAQDPGTTIRSADGGAGDFLRCLFLVASRRRWRTLKRGVKRDRAGAQALYCVYYPIGPLCEFVYRAVSDRDGDPGQKGRNGSRWRDGVAQVD